MYNLTSSAIPVAPSVVFSNDPRGARLAHEHIALKRSLSNYLGSRGEIVPLGPDPLVAQLLGALGFGQFDVVVVRVSINGKLATIIAVPTRIWRDPEARDAVLEAKRQAKEIRSRCILCPQRWLRAPIRAQVARMLAAGRRVQFSDRHAGAVLSALSRTRFATLQECASLVEHSDPFGVVLALIATGRLMIDRNKVLEGTSMVAIRPN